MKQTKRTLGISYRATATVGAAMAAACSLWSASASAEPTYQDYHYFRALSIDLQGRIPSRDEIAAFEKPGFDLDGWIDARLTGAVYAERVKRVYLDLLRLELPATFNYRPRMGILKRATIKGPTGENIFVHYRFSQRRARVETDGVFCLTFTESGLKNNTNGTMTGTPKNVTQAILDKYTTVVKPWWLYRDYSAAKPADMYDAASWSKDHPGFQPQDSLLKDLDGNVITEVRVCKEEAMKADTGTVFATGLTTPVKSGDVPPYDRLVQLPRDSSYATKHKDEPISCMSATAFQNSADCGCGVGLERCLPGTSDSLDPVAFVLPSDAPLGRNIPFVTANTNTSEWHKQAWADEAGAFIADIVANDRDFRDILQSKATVVNGPGAQFHKFFSGAQCCTDTFGVGYNEPTYLTDPSKMPTLLPHDMTKFVRVADRGPLASGILTMPAFLTKYGTRRARAHVIYNAFLCKEFVSANSMLMPSQEPDLTKRPGCQDCHATLEPMSAYFARIKENDWGYLPEEQFPVNNDACKDTGKPAAGTCKSYYDPAFATDKTGMLRGAYSSPENADAGPGALAAKITSSPEFSSCVAQNITASFLGRPLTADDEALHAELTKAFVDGGYHMKALIRAVLKSDVYRLGNDRLNPEEQ